MTDSTILGVLLFILDYYKVAPKAAEPLLTRLPPMSSE